MSLFRSRACCAADRDHSSAKRVCCYLLAFMLGATCVIPFTSIASAQCAARDVLQNQLKLRTRSVPAPEEPVRSAHDVPTWKAITIGGFADTFALRGALDSRGCNVGGQAAEIMARPAFTVSAQRTEVELVNVSPAQLGFTSGTVSLAGVYARAQQLGFELAPAEVGAQLRIQYVDQPVGEFLVIGMEPIKTWSGEPVILNVANGGAGLILIGQDGRATAEIPLTSRFVFARSHQSAPGAQLVEHAVGLLPPQRMTGAVSGIGN